MSAKNLLKKHKLICLEITSHQKLIDDVRVQTEKLKYDGKN